MRTHPALLPGAFLAGLCIILAPAGSAQSFPGGYSFVLSATDTSTASRFLPVFPRRPIGPGDFVSVTPDGHFSAGGNPIRFFGTNAVADGAFPSTNESWFVAGRLRRLGYNLVRLHHMDNPWAGTGSLFASMPDTRHLNPSVLDRLDKFLAELKANGVYANVNLHVSRTFTRADGVPDADSLQTFAKGYTFFDPILIALQKEYARQLLTHINPYTGHSLVNDPVMAMVEITNENSLYRLWQDGALKPYAQGGALPVRHQRLLDSLWGSSLRSRYASDSLLTAAWNTGARTGGQEMILNGSFDVEPFPTGWTLEQHAPAFAVPTRTISNVHGGVFSAKITVAPGSGTDWHVQWKQTGLSLTRDQSYTVTFAARADSIRTIGVNIMEDGSPYTWYAGRTVTVDTAWHVYTLLFTASATRTGTIRLGFSIGAASGVYYFDDVSMQTAALHGLLAGESLAAPPRRLEFAECAGFTDARVKDQTAFIIGLQKQFFRTMRSFLRDTLGVRVPIVGSNLTFTPPDIAAQAGMDYMDNHAYWDHPTFPGIPWSSTDWTISNTPMVSHTEGGTIGRLMNGIAQIGVPYTISEYNHPFPNIYASEGPLFLTAYAAFHDVDGLMFFAYNSTADWTGDVIRGYFEMHRNTALMAMMPSLAAVFRHNWIAPSIQVVSLDLSDDDVLLAPKAASHDWLGAPLVPTTLPLIHAVRVRTFGAAFSNLAQVPPPGTAPYESDTGELRWRPEGTLSVAAPSFAAITGIAPVLPGTLAGPLQLVAASDHCTVTWASTEGSRLDRTGRSLLTVASRVQNAGMVWDGVTTIHDQWGGPPTAVQPLTVTLKLHIGADSLTIWKLNPAGLEEGAGRTVLPVDTNSFVLTINQSVDQTPWFGLEAIGHGTLSSVPAPSLLDYQLEQNFPNPFNGISDIGYRTSELAHVELQVFDLLGRKVADLANERKAPGTYRVRFVADGLPSGIYVYRLKVGTRVFSRKMVLIR